MKLDNNSYVVNKDGVFQVMVSEMPIKTLQEVVQSLGSTYSEDIWLKKGSLGLHMVRKNKFREIRPVFKLSAIQITGQYEIMDTKEDGTQIVQFIVNRDNAGTSFPATATWHVPEWGELWGTVVDNSLYLTLVHDGVLFVPPLPNMFENGRMCLDLPAGVNDGYVTWVDAIIQLLHTSTWNADLAIPFNATVDGYDNMVEWALGAVVEEAGITFNSLKESVTSSLRQITDPKVREAFAAFLPPLKECIVEV